VFDTWKADLARYSGSSWGRLRALLFTPGAWAVTSYRFRRWVFEKRRIGLVQKPLNLLAMGVQAWTDVATNIQIPASARIGPGLFIAHTGYIVLSAEAVLGRQCTLTQGVTIGHAGGGGRGMKSPVVGNRVYIAPGAILLGGITVGNDALIGAGAVVIDDVPPRGVAVGNPARVVSTKGSFELVVYRGMDADDERRAALDSSA
jgi:serine O-acetyltransferase